MCDLSTVTYVFSFISAGSHQRRTSFEIMSKTLQLNGIDKYGLEQEIVLPFNALLPYSGAQRTFARNSLN